MNTRHLALPVALAFALAAPSAYALGLGQLQVKSGLNQPLVAEIPIISASAAELEQLDIRLASPEAFARVGLERPSELTANLQFSVGKNAQGQSVIRVSTADKFAEPLLSFLIEADWGKGRVTREYTALIDPPYIAPAVIQPMQAPIATSAPAQPAMPTAMAEPENPVAQTSPVAEPEPEAVTPTPEPAPIATAPAKPEPEPEPALAAPMPAEPALVSVSTLAPQTTEIPVESGQTLWVIAKSVRPDSSVSINQMMVALLRANPDAFSQDNINWLKSGSVLRIPSQEETRALSIDEATALAREQNQAWRQSRQPVPQPAESVAEAGMPATNATKMPAAAKPAVAKPVASGGSTKGSGSRLEIVPPSGKASARGAQSGAAAGAGGVELRAELVQAQEDLAARASEVTELKSRVADMEKQDADRQRLLEMKDSQLHALESRLKQLEVANNTVSPNSVAASASTAPIERTPAPTSKPKPVAATTEQWYLNPFMLGGGALVVLGGLVLALRRSKSGAQSEVPSHRLSDDDALRASLAQARAGSTAAHIAEVPEPLPMAEEETAESESERQILEAAVRSRPKDLETHLSLLRYFYAQNCASDYEMAAQAMRLQVGNTMDPRWREAVIMGAALIPDNILFSQVDWNSPRMSAIDPVLASVPPATENAHPSAVPDDDSNAQDWDALFAAERYAASEAADTPIAEAGTVEDDASATRVELAKAYLNIGDLEGARSMLEEVLAEGSETAKAEAERILREIG